MCVCVCVCRDKEVCSSGRQTLIILRCDTTTTDHDTTTTTTTTTTTSRQHQPVQVELSPRYAVGTCDGCNFVFLMRTRAACPVCTRRDFDTYKTTCVDERRSIITKMKTYVSLPLSVRPSACPPARPFVCLCVIHVTLC